MRHRPGDPINGRNAFYAPFWDSRARYNLVYGGGGSGKSVFTAQRVLALAKNVPDVRFLVLRKVAKTCRLSTFATFKDILRSMGRLREVKIKEQEMTLDFPGGGEIYHAGLDDVQKLKSIRGVTHVWVEEATELDFPASDKEEPDLAQIDLRLRGVSPALAPSVTLTFNPTHRARPLFDYVDVPESALPYRGHTTFDGGNVFVQHSTYEDNPFVGESFVQVFRRLGGRMQQIYEEGKLARVDDPDQLIPYEFVKRAIDLEPTPGVLYLGVDVATRVDNAVLMYKEGNAIGTPAPEVFENGLEIDRLSAVIAERIAEKPVNPERVAIDADGMGAGVADNLQGAGYPVTGIYSGGSPVAYRDGRNTQMQFQNLRSQMWHTLRENFRTGRTALTNPSRTLIEDLCAPHYKLAAEHRIKVEAKPSVKARLGRSPDEGDAAVYVEAADHLKLAGPKPRRRRHVSKSGY